MPRALCAVSLVGHSERVLNIEEVDQAVADDNLDLPLGPDTLASIFFTSSSTGPPKGVLQNHRNLLHCALRHINGCHVSDSDRLSFLASSAFAAALPDLLGALLSGAHASCRTRFGTKAWPGLARGSSGNESRSITPCRQFIAR